MARVKIPLTMGNGIKVRNMEEFKNNFDIEKVIEHFISGKLKKWLSDRYYEEEYEAVCKLEKSDCDLADKLCEIFGVEKGDNDAQGDNDIHININTIENRMKKFIANLEL